MFSKDHRTSLSVQEFRVTKMWQTLQLRFQTPLVDVRTRPHAQRMRPSPLSLVADHRIFILFSYRLTVCENDYFQARPWVPQLSLKLAA